MNIDEVRKHIGSNLSSDEELVGFFMAITRFTFKDVDDHLYAILGLSNVKEAAILWPLQIFTHLFIHCNPVHVLSNVVAIGIASVYEKTRRIKTLSNGSDSWSVFFSSFDIFLSRPYYSIWHFRRCIRSGSRLFYRP